MSITASVSKFVSILLSRADLEQQGTKALPTINAILTHCRCFHIFLDWCPKVTVFPYAPVRCCCSPVLPSFRPLTSSPTQVQLPVPERKCFYIQKRKDSFGENQLFALMPCHKFTAEAIKCCITGFTTELHPCREKMRLLLSLSLTKQALLPVWGSFWFPHPPSPPLPADPHTLSPRAQWCFWAVSVQLSAVTEMSLVLGCIWPAWSSSQASREEHSQLLSITTKVSQTHQAHPVTCGLCTTSFHLLFSPIHSTAAGWRMEKAFLLERKWKRGDQLLNILVSLELVYTKFLAVHDQLRQHTCYFYKKFIQHTIFTFSINEKINFVLFHRIWHIFLAV